MINAHHTSWRGVRDEDWNRRERMRVKLVADGAVHKEDARICGLMLRGDWR